MARLEFSVQAAADLDDVFAFSLRRFGFDTADDYFQGLQTTCDRLAEFPELGPILHGVRPPIRVFSHRSHDIFHRFDGRVVLMVRILHHAMNAAAHLR